MRQRVQHSLGQMLAEMDFLSLFAETGLPSVHSFTTEIVQRLAAKVVPSAREDTDARKLLIDLYSSETIRAAIRGPVSRDSSSAS